MTAAALLSAAAVRSRARIMLAACEADALAHWRLDRAQLPAIADYVVETMRLNYPTLAIPFHARWRHFSVGGRDRWAALAFPDTDAKARAAFDLAIVSVLLDAGAGPAWRYRDASGAVYTRSEGLAVASIEMFARGAFANDGAPRADAARLAAFDDAALAQGMQAGPDNPLVGLAGRAALLRALGRVVQAAPAVFNGRPGGLYDHSRKGGDTLPAADILHALLIHFGAIWPSSLEHDGAPLGDAWRHSAIVTHDATTGIMPFHKLSQWLAYSLIEPLQEAGVAVTDIDALTGLPEYRNGGLFIDMGALVAREPSALVQPHEVGAALVVEWRALTVALLDEIAELVRAKLGCDAVSLPLACVLEGGTWAAGRRIAAARRPGGGPPLTIISDGAVF